MKNISFALFAILVGVLPACTASQEPTGTGATPTPTVTVPPVQTSEPVADKPKDDKPPADQPPPVDEPPPSGGRLALLQCSEESRKVKGCTRESKPVCAEVDTGIRCIRAPCPSTAQQTYENACSACVNKNVRGYWAMSCEDMAKATAP